MSQQPYTIDQAANLLGLHAKTVRGYVRDGRLKAVRVGKQYRIAREDLDAFAGYPVAPPAAETARRTRHSEVSAVVRIEAISREATMRVSNAVMATIGGRDDRRRLRVETVYDEERAVLQVIVVGGLEDAAGLLKIIQVLTEEGP
ncbi:helix-turn-helix domain-containing protein [Sphaerisporangium dianthi]|uniref:Helix-turn-helix domain-containing protein n=1 Tax=Sphaerisporangium dianthi TaxID=1436120 RepID=A0ABV9CQA9_9ACTN